MKRLVSHASTHAIQSLAVVLATVFVNLWRVYRLGLGLAVHPTLTCARSLYYIYFNMSCVACVQAVLGV